MSSLPFRTAFWALGLSLMMTVMLMIPNPQKIRMALNAERESSEFPFQETLITSLDQPAPSVDLPSIKLDRVEETPAEPRRDARRRLRPSAPVSENKTEAVEAAPVRIASADPTASIGYQPAPTSSRAAAPPVPDFTPAPVKEPVAQSAPAETESAGMQQLNIPVPDPQEPKAVQVAEAPSVKSATDMQPATDRPGDLVESRPIPAPGVEPLARIKQADPQFVASTFPAATAQMGETGFSSHSGELSNDPTVSITAGSVPKRWNFRFQEASLQNVFKVLAQYQGFTVVVDEGISGTYSGQFLEADPSQAFAVLVKSRNCRVSRRGNMILLSSERAGTHR